MQLLSRYTRYIIVIIFLLLIIIYTYRTYELASDNNMREYVSDEVWYVNSARNILRTIFGLQPKYIDAQGYAYYTIVFSNTSEEQNNEIAVQNITSTLHGNITKIYTQFPGIGIKIPENESINAFLSLPGIVFIQSGYPYPDVSNIEYYMNYEHPPLFKYLLGASMMALGDNPLNWRIPSLIMGISSIIIAFLIVLQLTKMLMNPIARILAIILTLIPPFFDAIMINMTAIALLDIGLAFFSILSLYFAINNRYIFSSIMIGLAISIKMSGIFLIPALYVAMRLKGKTIRDALLVSLYMPLLLWFIMNLPIIYYLGLQQWLNSNVYGAISWHLSSRPPNGPPTSTPWGWLINENPFYLHFNPTMSATLNSGVYLITLILIFLAPFITSKINNKNLIIPTFWFIFPLLGYTTVYILGNHTLYSFYAVMISPIAYVILGSLLVILIELTYTFRISDILKWHKNIIIKLLKGEIQLPMEFNIQKALAQRVEEEYIILFAMMIITFSFIIHLPSNLNLTPFNIYSDIVSIAQSISNNKIPYINYVITQPLLTSIIIYITYILSNLDPNPAFSFYIINTLLIYIAAYYLFKDLYWITEKLNIPWWRILLLAGSLTMIMYSVYSWEIIATALSIRALRYFMDNKSSNSAILFGLAFNISPISTIPILAIMSTLNKKSIIKYASTILLIIITLNLPFMIINTNLWIINTLNIAWNTITGTFLIELFNNPEIIKYISITSIATSLILLFLNYKPKTYKTLNHKIFDLSWKSMAITLSLSYIYTPQTTLQLLPYMILTQNIAPLFIILTDLLNALIIITWFNYKEWSQALFKITPESPLDKTAMPTILSALRNIIILIALITTLKTNHKVDLKKQYGHS